MLSEGKCQLLAPPKQEVRGTEPLQVPHTITAFHLGCWVSFFITAITNTLEKLVLCIFLTLSYQKHPMWTCFHHFLLFLPHRRSVWKVPGAGQCRPVHIRYFFLCSATPQDPPTETGSQRYAVCLPVRLLSELLFFFSSAAFISRVQGLQRKLVRCHRAKQAK